MSQLHGGMKDDHTDDDCWFRHFAESAHDVVFRVNLKPSLSLEYVNAAVKRVTGYKPSRFHSDPELFFEIIHPEDRALYEMVRKGKWDESKPLIIRWIRKDGRTIWIEQQVIIVHDDRGQPSAIEGIARDISEKIRAEEALRERLEIELTLADIASSFVWSGDLDGMIGDVLEAVGKLTGAVRARLFRFQDKGEVIREDHNWSGSGSAAPQGGKLRLETKQFPRLLRKMRNREIVHFRDSFPDTDNLSPELKLFCTPECTAILVLPMASKSDIVGFILIENPSKVSGWSSDDLQILNFFSRLIGNGIDREKVEQRLKRLAIAVESSAESIVITDNTGIIQYVNPAFEKCTGYTAEEAIGETLSIIKSGEHDEAFYRSLWETISRGDVWHGRIRNRRKNGTFYPEDVSISPVKNPDGEIIHFVSVRKDVSRELMLESQLRQAQKLESIGQLAAGIAHEINTPIQFVSDNIRFLQKGFDKIEELIVTIRDQYAESESEFSAIEAMETIREAMAEVKLDFLLSEIPDALGQSMVGVERVTKIVRAMKEFSHPGSQEKAPFNLNDALESTIIVARNEYKYVADLETDFAPDLPLVSGFAADLNQVFLNLITNAAHAIEEKIGSHPAEKGTIRIQTRKVGEMAEFQITDTGGGIPDKIRERIFDPFFTTKKVGRGTGQGLAIVYNTIVEKHHGTVDVKTREGEGTTFIVRLPL